MDTQSEGEKAGFIVLPGAEMPMVVLPQQADSNRSQDDFLVLGRCMYPALHPGDRLQIAQEKRPVRLGSIVAFRWEGRILTHRVIKIRGGIFWARGDVGASVQGPIRSQDTLGRVVAYQRDGKWHRLERLGQRFWGLGYNVVMNRLMLTNHRWPRLKQAVEMNLLGSRFSRKIYAKARPWLFGRIVVAEEQSPEYILGVIFSSDSPYDERHAKLVEKQLAQGLLKLLVARSSKRGRIGHLFLTRVCIQGHAILGYISTLQVSLGARGMGIGRRLLFTAEQKATEYGIARLTALVSSDNLRSLYLFRSMGYGVVSDNELKNRTREEREAVAPGKIYLEKRIHSG